MTLCAVLDIKHQIQQGHISVVRLIGTRLLTLIPMAHINPRGCDANAIDRTTLQQHTVGLVIIKSSNLHVVVCPVPSMFNERPDGQLTLTFVHAIAPLTDDLVGIKGLLAFTAQGNHVEALVRNRNGIQSQRIT